MAQRKVIPKFDKSGYNYALKKQVQCLYVDMNSGEIMQFSTDKHKKNFETEWSGLFPNREMRVFTLTEYQKEMNL